MPAFIDDSDFNDQFNRTLSAATRGCADLGEAIATIARITPGDFDSWYREWTRTAEQVMAEGDESLGQDQNISARRCYLRAAEYYRQAFFFARDDLERPELHTAYDAHVAAFRAAIPLLPYSVETVEIDQNGVAVSGYLLRPDSSDTPRPTVIAPAGYDSTAEAGYSFTAVTALEHGMNCLTFEGPGQGGILYQRRQYFRPDFEAVLTPVIDWLVKQTGVDAGALILFGRSFAGYLAPRGATAEHRLTALVCDPAQYDFGAAVRAQTGEAVWARLQAHDPSLDADLAPMMADPHRANGFRARMASHGLSSMSDYLRELGRFTLVGRAENISCRTLALAGEGDFAGTGQLQVFADALHVPVTTHEFTAAEGAGGHCEGLGQDRLDRVVYDWLQAGL